MRSRHAVAISPFRITPPLLAILLAGVGCSGDRAPLRLSAPSTLAGAPAVGTSPMFAVSRTGTEALAWVSAPNGGTDGRIYVSVGSAAPVEIQDSLGPIEAHGESPPKIAYASDGTLYIAYVVGKVVPSERFPLSALRLVRSSDGGKTWSEPVTVTGDPVFGYHSYHGFHVADDGTVYVSWLGRPDSELAPTPAPVAAARPMVTAVANSRPAAPAPAAPAREAAATWIVRSVDGGRTWQPRVRVDMGEACPCCRTAVTTARNGTVYLAWRHVYPGNVRDIVVARSTDHGTTWSAPVRVHADDWHFNACPHAGPAIAVDSSGTLHVAWWTGKEGSAGVFYAQSRDSGVSFSPPIALGVAQYSQAAHVQIALASAGRVLVVWDDGTKQTPRVVVRMSANDGASFGPSMVLSSEGRAATFPVLAVAGDSVAVAWSEESAATAQAKAEAKRQMSQQMGQHKMAMGLDAVGQLQVVIRRGVL